MYADAIVDLRRSRRRRRLQKINVSEALYRGYLTVISVAAAVWVLANLPKDTHVNPRHVAQAAAHGPAAVGLVVAFAVVLAIRSGSRGGPLVLEAPDIQHLLLAPLPRGEVLRAPALQRIRTMVLGGALIGAVVGLLASKRFPKPLVAWVASGTAAGAIAGGLMVGAGLLASGRRLRPWLGSLIGLAILGWSVADVRFHVETSPMTLVGRTVLAPISGGPWAWAVVLLPLVLILLALASLGGLSLEAAMRRASLVGQLRFALAVRDLRTVVVLSRLLAEERPRRRPLIRLRASSGTFWAVWKRDWQGLLRWPGARLVRVLVLSAIAGACLRGVWEGTTPLLFAAGVCLWLVGMDADVGMAGEVDRSDTAKSLPVEQGELLLRHVPAGVVAVILVAGIGGLAGAQIGGFSSRSFQLAIICLPVAAVAAVAASAVSTVRSVYGSGGGGLFAFSPEATGITVVIREVLPPAIATTGVLPVWAAHHLAKKPSLELSVAASWGWLPLFLAGIVAVWLSYRGLK